ncbi:MULTISPECIES: hypothetical protein [Henriciella]|jgi:hypothetical protein|uniref:hypothetical protein n=2 Tax=Hyphomonadaceae TaxID=69657 RepID=UPI0035147973
MPKMTTQILRKVGIVSGIINLMYFFPAILGSIVFDRPINSHIADKALIIWCFFLASYGAEVLFYESGSRRPGGQIGSIALYCFTIVVGALIMIKLSGVA